MYDNVVAFCYIFFEINEDIYLLLKEHEVKEAETKAVKARLKPYVSRLPSSR